MIPYIGFICFAGIRIKIICPNDVKPSHTKSHIKTTSTREKGNGQIASVTFFPVKRLPCRKFSKKIILPYH